MKRAVRKSATTEPIEVYGWACDNYVTGGPPPVLVNSEASALSLLSWGLGQLQECNNMMDALGGDWATVHQFSMQAETVLRAGVEKLHAAALST